MLERLKEYALRLKAETHALYLASRDPRTPWYAKLVAAAVVAYAFSPLDLIPDFVPVLGYLDDLILVPAGIALAIRLVPGTVMAECRQRVRERENSVRPTSWWGAAVVGAIWLAVAVLVGFWAVEGLSG